MSVMKWLARRRATSLADLREETVEKAVFGTRPRIGAWLLTTPPAALAPLVVVDPNAPQRTKQSLQQLADRVNSLVRAGRLTFAGAADWELSYRPANKAHHPIGTPDVLELWDALDRLAERLSDGGL